MDKVLHQVASFKDRAAFQTEAWHVSDECGHNLPRRRPERRVIQHQPSQGEGCFGAWDWKHAWLVATTVLWENDSFNRSRTGERCGALAPRADVPNAPFESLDIVAAL